MREHSQIYYQNTDASKHIYTVKLRLVYGF